MTAMTDHREKVEAKLARLADAASRIAGRLDRCYRLEAEVHATLTEIDAFEGILSQRRNKRNAKRARNVPPC